MEFAIWLSMRRERVCLAQRVGSGARLTGLVKRTVRNMLTELFAHAWPRRWPAFAALERKERSAYEHSVLEQVDGQHKPAARTLTSVQISGLLTTRRRTVVTVTAFSQSRTST